jgi:hypothetical protein
MTLIKRSVSEGGGAFQLSYIHSSTVRIRYISINEFSLNGDLNSILYFALKCGFIKSKYGVFESNSE